MGKTPATYQDVIDAPEHLRAELIDGELVLMGRGRTRHAWASFDVASGVRDGFGRDDTGWWILPEVELWLGPADAPNARVLIPDVSGWRRSRYTPGPDTVGHTVPPDWLCEVLSPSSASHDRVRKLALYAEAAVPWYWIVDPEAHTVEVLSLRDGVYAIVATHEGGGDARLPPFDAVALDAGRWWMDATATFGGATEP